MDRLNGLNEKDFSARWLDNAIPGFTCSDPLAERHPDESPYLYCGNNPVNRVDPSGMEWYTKVGGSSNDYYFLENISVKPTYNSGGQNYNYAGETVSYWLSDINNITTSMNGDKDGKWSEMHNPDMASPTVSAINLSLASRFTLSIYATSGEIGGNSNNYVSRSSGNNGNSNSGQNGDDRLSKLPAAAGMTVDVMITTGAIIKATKKLLKL